MMKRVTTLIAFILLGQSVDARGIDPRHPSWMVGTWVTLNSGEHFSSDLCNADHNVTYYRNGTYDLMDMSGRWHIAGDHLVETMTRSEDSSDNHDLNRPKSARIKRIARNKVRLYWPKVGTEDMVQCVGH